MQGRFEFSGRLCRSDKRPANPGLYQLQFQLHGQPKDGQRDKVYWEEVLEKVEVAPGGFYSVVLGQQEPVDPATFSRGVRWLSVRVVRAGSLDEETGPRSPIMGHWFRIYASLDRIDARLEDFEVAASSIREGQARLDELEGSMDDMASALASIHARLVPIETGTEINAVVRRVETLSERMGALDKEDGRVDRLEMELEDLVGPDGDVVDLNERMDRIEGQAPDLIARLRSRQREDSDLSGLAALREQLTALQARIEAAETQGASAPAARSGSSEVSGAVKRTGDVMTGGLTINRGGLDVVSGGVTCRGAQVTTLEASNVIKAPKVLADAFELRGDFTVDSAARVMQVRHIEGRQASARRDGALLLNGRGGGEVILGTEEASRGADVHGSMRASSLVAHAVGGVAQCFHATGNISAGDVVRVNDSGERVARVRKQADPRVMGVITDDPGLLLGGTARTGVVMVAVTGVVACKVDASQRPIRAGDLLVASNEAGHAMGADDPQPGTIIGKALAPLEAGKGTIPVLLGGG